MTHNTQMRLAALIVVLSATSGVVVGERDAKEASSAWMVTPDSDGAEQPSTDTLGSEVPMRAMVRGDFYDARRVIEMLRQVLSANKPVAFDVDLDIKVARLVGFNSQVLHDAELRLLWRGGEGAEFAMRGEHGHRMDLRGELRREANGKRIIHLEARDAGAFLKFMGVSEHVNGGRMQISAEITEGEHTAQDSTLEIWDFALTGDSVSKSFIMSMNGMANGENRIEFSHLLARFKLYPGEIVINEGLIYAASICGTANGRIDLSNDRIALRGTALPLTQISPKGPLWMLPSEGLVSFEYDVAGPLHAPVLRANPFGYSPGTLRRLLRFMQEASRPAQ